MATLKDVKRIVIKVGTSTLTHHTGKSNIRQIKKLVAVISDIVNSGVEVALVTSGAIGVGVGKLGLRDRPTNTAGKQAAATIGQCELMFMYDKMFAEFGHTVGQFLITKRDVDNDECRENLINAFEKTFEYGAIPIINELMKRQVLSDSEKGYLGITGKTISDSVSEAYGIPVGVYVSEVSDSGAAKAAGIKKGDVITKINDAKVSLSPTLISSTAKVSFSLMIGTTSYSINACIA